jgi:hypothetical protein
VRQSLRLFYRRFDFVETEIVRDLLGEVDDVIEHRGQLENVLTVDRRHECVIQGLDDGVDDPITLLLTDQNVAREPCPVRVAFKHVIQQLRGPNDVRSSLLKRVEELRVAPTEQPS